MRKLLWIGDAAVSTGFARCTHFILDELRKTWDISVLGLNYVGDPHDWPYKIYPCWPGGDAFGLGRVAAILEQVKPDLIVIQNDPWNFPEYIKRIEKIPTVGFVAVDGKNCRGTDLNGLDLAVFWTEFARQEAIEGGLTVKSEVIPLGVDLEIYKPMDRLEARKALMIPESMWDGFIFGNINRNQPRKRLDLTIEYFCDWTKLFNIKDAYLFLHVAPTGDQGYDCVQLMNYHGLKNRLILSVPDIGHGAEETDLVLAYNSFDVQITTTQGEGWGLTQMEGMACGIPQIVPDWAALAEWTGTAAKHVPCTSHITTPGNINSIGGVPDKKEFMVAMNQLFKKAEERRFLKSEGLALVQRPEYQWPNIAKKFAETIEI